MKTEFYDFYCNGMYYKKLSETKDNNGNKILETMVFKIADNG